MRFERLIPGDTIQVQLFKLVDFVKPSNQDNLPENFLYYGTGDFWNGTPTETNRKDAPGRARMLLVEGDVLYRTSFPAHDGAVYVSPTYANQVASNGFTQMRVRSELNPKYLAHLLNSLKTWNYIRQNSAGILNVVQGGAFERTLIDLPSLEIQEQIVNILDAHNEIAELQAERVRLLKLKKDVLLENIFAPGEGFRFSLGGKNFDTREWPFVPIESMFTMRGGGELVSSDLWAKVMTVDNPVPVWNSGTRASGYFSRSNRSGPSIFIAAIGDGSSGHVDFIEGEYFAGGLFNEFRPIDEIGELELYFAYLGIKRLQPHFLAERSGSSQKTFNWKQSKKRTIPQPKKRDQQIISEYFLEIDNHIKLEEERLQLLKTQSAVVLESIFSK